MSPLARATEHELLDDPGLAAAELRRNLREMAMLNRLPGGVGNSCRAVTKLLDGRADASVLDVGIGSGDFARRLARERDGVRIIGLDLREDVLEIAARNLAGTNHVTLIAGDARAVPLPDASVDIAHASLLLHHLDPPDAVQALREMRRVARRGVVVNDLRRGRAAYGVTAGVVLALARSPVTRHDGLLSARRAHTLEELDALADRAGLRRVARSAALLPRVTTVYA
jgi:ubiquinone/menaquinone biosynthesis C-methylase UbiE